jgi:hypothetical protein
MWLLHLMPEGMILFIVYAALGLGLAGIILGFFLRIVPFVNQYRIPVQIVSIIVFCSGVYWYGGYQTEMIWRRQVAELEAKIKESENRAPEITKEIVTKYKDRVMIVKQGVEVIKKEIEEKKIYINEGCKLNPTAVEMYNQGITGPADAK